MGVHFIWINKVPYPTESIYKRAISKNNDLSTVVRVSKKLKWMIDIEMKWIRLYSFKIYNKCFQSPSLGQMLPFCRFDCPFVAYGTVIQRIQLWALYIFFLERNKS